MVTVMLLACSLPVFAQTSGTTNVIPIGGKWTPIFGNQPLDSLQAACEFEFNFSTKNSTSTPSPACKIRRLSGRYAYSHPGFGWCYTETPKTKGTWIDGKYTSVCTGEFIENYSRLLILHTPATCPVEPLKPITDPDTLLFENGDNVREDKLTPSMKTKLQCLKNSGVGFKTTSAWRPQTYQDHLYEVYTKLLNFDKVVKGKKSQKKVIID